MISPKVFIQYKEINNGNEKIVSGYFQLLSETDHEVKIISGPNKLTISKSMILKMKESLNTNNYKGVLNKK